MIGIEKVIAFEYTFCVWPDETWKHDPAIFQLFEVLNRRIGLEFTPEQFERFRSGLSHHGLTLREIERVPHQVPESIT